jgi:hypothetical protein
MSRLELKLAERRNGRKYLDFVVDGESLFERIGHQFDTVSCLTLWPVVEETHKSLNRLLLVEEADFPGDRRALYVCGECGGLDCGAVSIVIEEDKDTVTWREFGYENSWDDNVEKFEEIGPFVFQKEQYTKTLKVSIATLQHAS